MERAFQSVAIKGGEMPIVRTDLIEGKSEEYRAQVGEIVYETLVDVLNVPKGDRFQVITEHRKSALPLDRDYLGVHRTDDCIFSQITLNAGGSVELKQSFYRELTERLHQGVQLRKEDVFINLVEVPKRCQKRIGPMGMDWPSMFRADCPFKLTGSVGAKPALRDFRSNERRGNKMTYLNDLGRRSFLKIAAVFGGASTVGVLPNLARAQNTDTRQQTDAPVTTLQGVPLSSGAKVTIERRGQIVLIGINRPYIQNRIDPETFEKLAEAYYQYDHDSSLRAAILFGHGDNFSRGIDVEGFKSLAGTGKPWIASTGTIDPLAKRAPRLTKPLIVVTHGDTWNMAHEFFLGADIRIASAGTRFGQDENTHGRFPGGGSTVRFVREVGWGNAMGYMLTGEHWSAEEAYRIGEVQQVASTPEKALEAGLQMANKVAACGPLGIKATLLSAHLAIDPAEADALSKLDAQFGALFHTRDFQEGRDAEAQGRAPVYQGR
jgi:enoyl-CoA hydratase/carnithine racemase